jgi:hypothetical protein
MQAEFADALRDVFGNPWRPVAASEEICECGDWKSDHQNGGPCAVCCQSRAPYDGCEAFRATGTFYKRHWLSSCTIVSIARTIHHEQAWAELPILADALEEAGCDCEPLLAHLRNEPVVCPECNGTGYHRYYPDLGGKPNYSDQGGCEYCDNGRFPANAVHCRGCWALRLILGDHEWLDANEQTRLSRRDV